MKLDFSSDGALCQSSKNTHLEKLHRNVDIHVGANIELKVNG